MRVTHTGEALELDYRPGLATPAGVWKRVGWFLRDFRTGDVDAIDPQLLDQLYALSVATRTNAAFEVISGYRSAVTNEALQKRSGGVVAHSLHREGRAIDVRLGDIRLEVLRDAALSLRGACGPRRRCRA